MAVNAKTVDYETMVELLENQFEEDEFDSLEDAYAAFQTLFEQIPVDEEKLLERVEMTMQDIANMLDHPYYE